jgi:hypothetical protein
VTCERLEPGLERLRLSHHPSRVARPHEGRVRGQGLTVTDPDMRSGWMLQKYE